MITTTLNRIKECSPCQDGWEKLLKYLGKTKADDEPLPYSVIVESNGISDALWCCRAESKYDKEWRLFAVWCVRQVKHLMKDKRSVEALDIAEKYAYGAASDEELRAAREAAMAAARAAAWAAAGSAARAAARAAAWEAAMAAARAAAGEATREAAWEAAWSVAWETAMENQKKKFLEIVG